MDLTEVVIAPEEGKKGRSFRALHLASTYADALWKGGETKGKTDVTRPVMAIFLGSEAEMRPFAANLQLGRLASTAGDQSGYGRRHRTKAGYEFLRSASYKQAWQRHEEGVILTVYLPDLFALDPGMVDPEEAKFVLAPSKVWASAQTLIPTAEIVRHARKLSFVREMNTPPPKDDWRRKDFARPLPDERLADLAPTAYLFAAYLDRRTRAPILADGRFYMQLMLACLKQGLASWSTSGQAGYGEHPFGEHGALGFLEDHEDGCGLLPGLAFRADHGQVEALLSSEIETYYEITKGK